MQESVRPRRAYDAIFAEPDFRAPPGIDSAVFVRAERLAFEVGTD